MRALPRGTGVALIRFRGTVNKTILLVDDDLHSREGLRQSLVGGGFMVATAQDGAQAIKQMIESEVGMAIIDLDLPPVKGVTISGWDVVRICRAFDAAMPIIVVTAEGGPEVRARAKELKVLECLEKPIAPGQVKGIVRAIDR
jgi:DNA-binding response OmpR family regulator